MSLANFLVVQINNIFNGFAGCYAIHSWHMRVHVCNDRNDDDNDDNDDDDDDDDDVSSNGVGDDCEL